MRRLILAGLILALSISAFARDSKPHGKVVSITVHSAALEHNRVKDSPDRDVSIYLPPEYESGTRRYPVLYLLHGYTGNERAWLNPSYVGLPELMDRLLQQHAIQPMIVVMPNSFNRFGGSFYANSALSGDWEDFIARDLVSYIDAHYRTLPQASGRGIAGHSMGGYGALRLGMHHPEVFSAAYGMSPCCSYWDEQEDRPGVVQAQRAKTLDEIFQAGMGPQVDLALAAAFSPDLANPPFGVDWPFDSKGQPVPAVIARWKSNLLDEIAAGYATGEPRLHALGFDVGRQDENNDIVTGSKKLDQQMTRLAIPHTYSEYNGTHSSRIGERMEKVVLPFMSSALAGESGSAAAKQAGR
ncbi:MAG: alpha/beta fold hydrolase [Candidatus Korobacteraceae bacterium]